jgi:hypothetical protein
VLASKTFVPGIGDAEAIIIDYGFWAQAVSSFALIQTKKVHI